MKKHGEGSIRKTEKGYECIIQTSVLNDKGKPVRIKRTGKTEEEALKRCKEAVASLKIEGENILNNEKKKKFGVLLKEFLDEVVRPNISGSTYLNYTNLYNASIKDYRIANLPVNKLTQKEFQDYYDLLTSRKMIKSCVTPINLCRRCCEWLVDRKILEGNYAKLAKIKKDKKDEYIREKEEDQRKKFLNEEDIKKLFYAYKNNMSEYAPVFILMLETMMRGQEVLALTISDIDFDNDIIHVRSAIGRRLVEGSEKYKSEIYIKVPKNGEDRIVPMTPLSKEILTGLINQVNIRCTQNPYNLVFPSYGKNGSIRRMVTMENAFKKLCDKLNIDRDVRDTKGGVRFGLNVHSLRHTADTIANTADGANVFNTALVAGHKSVEMEKVYTHAMIENLRKVKTASTEILDLDEGLRDKEGNKYDISHRLNEERKEKDRERELKKKQKTYKVTSDKLFGVNENRSVESDESEMSMDDVLKHIKRK